MEEFQQNHWKPKFLPALGIISCVVIGFCVSFGELSIVFSATSWPLSLLTALIAKVMEWLYVI